MKYRFKFSKKEGLKYIGHLDLVNIFHRALSMSNLPIKFSEGYNQRPIISIAMPLSLGQISSGEYAEMEFTEDLSVDEVKEKLNNKLPDDIKIDRIEKYEGKKPKMMSQIRAASYKIKCKDNSIDAKELINKEQFIVKKVKKKKVKEIDVRDLIIDAKNENGFLKLLVHSGSIKHLNPRLLMKGYGIEQYECLIERTDLYKEKENKLVPLVEK